MELQNLPKTTEVKIRRVGRGHGTGRGKTAGRGTKGQKARGKVPLFFEGGALPLSKRLPFLKGRGRNKIIKRHPIAINISKLDNFSAKIVDVESLIAAGVVDKSARKNGVKIIGNYELKTALTVNLPVSKSAREKIEKAKGTISLS